MKIAPLSRLNANGFPTRAWLLETFPSHFQKRTRFLKLDSVLRQYSPAQLEVSADFWNWITGATPGTPLRFRISSKAAPTSALTFDEQQRQQQQQSPPQRHCNEQLHPTTSTHTGPIYPCAHHAYHHGYNFNVCTGCREAYFWQGRFSPAATAIVRNGARVPVCTPCAYAYEEMFPPGYNGCRCDMAWLCFRCRVVELEGLVKAKRGYNKGEVDEGMCPCAEGRFADQFCGVEFCLRCERPALKERVFVGGHT
ncbi:hypothetical protein K432DRAFT_338529 [Lepidopterella palustris CBS 459.81]|uniref:Uncharacterized protein n=1 Tax=Lepidopterella palustris CBS 459.81 TaxID=1314670 RepID=A0A8E2DZV9_9PEZI|nr:hypothetical protein K432DRAFT_338529 [Lepidopterella palustris CBS 459.81]